MNPWRAKLLEAEARKRAEERESAASSRSDALASAKLAEAAERARVWDGFLLVLVLPFLVLGWLLAPAAFLFALSVIVDVVTAYLGAL